MFKCVERAMFIFHFGLQDCLEAQLAYWMTDQSLLSAHASIWLWISKRSGAVLILTSLAFIELALCFCIFLVLLLFALLDHDLFLNTIEQSSKPFANY